MLIRKCVHTAAAAGQVVYLQGILSGISAMMTTKNIPYSSLNIRAFTVVVKLRCSSPVLKSPLPVWPPLITSGSAQSEGC